MKTFNDLVFVDHEFSSLGVLKSRASEFFDNGYGVSVITGMGAHTSGEEPYELAVLKGTPEAFTIDYNNPVAEGDVVGYLDESGVTDMMKKVQRFAKDDG